MKALKKNPPLEKTVQRGIVKKLSSLGYLVLKTHGNKYQHGFPDLFCHHPDHGTRWIEVKRPKLGKLSKTQIASFAKWESYGIGIWILTGADQVDLLLDRPNWRDYATLSEER